MDRVDPRSAVLPRQVPSSRPLADGANSGFHPKTPTTMPVANPALVRLTPVDTTGKPTTANDYLKAQPPTCHFLKASLALSTFFVIGYFCLRHFWKRGQRGQRLVTSTAHHSFVSRAPEKVAEDQPAQGFGPSVDVKRREAGENKDEIMGVANPDALRYPDRHGTPKPSRHALQPQWNNANEASHFRVLTRPPPAPPLTPPELSTTLFAFQDRPQSRDSFHLQENPDYMSVTTAESPDSETYATSSSTMRRRSYTKTIPLDIPAPRRPSTTVAEAAIMGPSASYPPTSALLPPAPPSHQPGEDQVASTREIEVRGEVVSLMDDQGTGWMRHTRVYGGGVCLACAASGGTHGGFYGANVSPEEMH